MARLWQRSVVVRRISRSIASLALLVGLAIRAPVVGAQTPQQLSEAGIPPEALGRLVEAANDSVAGSALEPWQRDFMLGLASGASANDGIWSSAPSPDRYYHAAIFDPVRDRMLIFGGWDGTYRNDVWALSLSGPPAWTELTPAGTPPVGRYAPSAIYDPVRDRMLVFGGYDGTDTYRNDTWALTLSGGLAWSEIAPSGTLPPVRRGHSAIYDPVRDRMVIYGGYGGIFRADTWTLSLSGAPAWTDLGITAPFQLAFHTAIYDPVRDRMVVFGGTTASSVRDNVLSLQLAGTPAWTLLTPAGVPPSARLAHTAIYDPARDRMVVFGGWGGNFRNDTWTLTFGGGPAWSLLAPAGSPPSVRDLHAAIYDPPRDRMVVYGGNDGSGYLNDTWALSLAGLTSWSDVANPGGRPSARDLHAAIHDPVRDRMVVFGGYSGTAVDEVWVLSLALPPTWTRLTPAGTPPSARWGHAAVYDPVRDRMIVFGGRNPAFFADVWALSLSEPPTWSPLSPAGTPPSARYLHTAIYDPVRDCMVVFGGFDGTILRDLWSLSLSGTPAWSSFAGGGTEPPVRFLHTAIHDGPRDRMLVFGGYDGGRYLNDTWALSFAGSPAWTQIATTGGLPPVRLAHTAIRDPLRDRMVVFGGYGGTFGNDTWALSLGEGPAWSLLAPGGSPPAPRELHSAIHDPVRDRMVVFGGHDQHLRDDLFVLTWGDPPPPPPPPSIGMAFELPHKVLNLRSHGLWVTGRLEPAAPASADDIDIGSIRLNGTVPVDPSAPFSLGDADGNGVSDLKVRFDRASVEETVPDGDQVPMVVTGTLAGTAFSATTLVRVRRARVTAPQGGSHLTAGSWTSVQWDTTAIDTSQAASTDSSAVDTTSFVALLHSLDDGVTWDLIASGQPNTGSYVWTVPQAPSPHARVAVVLVQSADSTGDVVDGPLGVSDAFSIEAQVGVGEPGSARSRLSATPNPARNGRLRVEFALRDGAPARLEVTDISGRMVAAEDVGAMGPGLHAIEVSRHRPLAAGVYIVRLTQGGDQVRMKVAVMR